MGFGAKPPYRSSAICATATCSGFVRLTASILAWTRGGSPSNIAPAWMPGVYAQGLCRTQSQQSIHSLSRGKGGFRQGCRNKDTPRFKHGCLQVVEQSRCRTHRQQTTTVAQRQSHQSVLKGIGIENLLYFYKYRLFLQSRQAVFRLLLF